MPAAFADCRQPRLPPLLRFDFRLLDAPYALLRLLDALPSLMLFAIDAIAFAARHVCCCHTRAAMMPCLLR